MTIAIDTSLKRTKRDFFVLIFNFILEQSFFWAASYGKVSRRKLGRMCYYLDT